MTEQAGKTQCELKGERGCEGVGDFREEYNACETESFGSTRSVA